MNTCEHFAALLDAYADGELTAEETAAVQAHLDGCPRCRAELEAILSLREGFPSWEETEVPEGFAQSVLDALPQPAKRAGGRRWWKAAVSLAACCAVLVLAARLAPLGRSGSNSAATAESFAAGGDAAAAEGEPAASGAAGAETEAQAAKDAAVRMPEIGAESSAGSSAALAEAADSPSLFAAQTDPVYRRWATVSLTAAQADRLLGDREPVSGGDGPVRYEFSVQDFDSILQKLEQEGLTLETAVEDAGAEGETCCLYVDLIY